MCTRVASASPQASHRYETGWLVLQGCAKGSGVLAGAGERDLGVGAAVYQHDVRLLVTWRLVYVRIMRTACGA